MIRFDGVRVFSATRAPEREVIGDVIANWIAAHPSYEVVDKNVLLSSDASFHCLTIILYFRIRPQAG